MDARTAFKQGFIAGCIEQGITTPTAIRDFVKAALAKNANGGLAGILGLEAFGDIAKGVSHVGSTALGWGIPLLAATPPLLGAAAGTLAAKATDTDDTDVDEIKRQEINEEYRRQAGRLRREGLVRRQAQPAPRRYF